jgi:hypothetical protein
MMCGDSFLVLCVWRPESLCYLDDSQDLRSFLILLFEYAMDAFFVNLFFFYAHDS